MEKIKSFEFKKGDSLEKCIEIIVSYLPEFINHHHDMIQEDNSIIIIK